MGKVFEKFKLHTQGPASELKNRFLFCKTCKRQTDRNLVLAQSSVKCTHGKTFQGLMTASNLKLWFGALEALIRNIWGKMDWWNLKSSINILYKAFQVWDVFARTEEVGSSWEPCKCWLPFLPLFFLTSQ